MGGGAVVRTADVARWWQIEKRVTPAGNRRSKGRDLVGDWANGTRSNGCKVEKGAEHGGITLRIYKVRVQVSDGVYTCAGDRRSGSGEAPVLLMQSWN